MASATSGQQDLCRCPVCLQPFTQPKLLPVCGHTFCLQCLQKLPPSTPKSVRCPLCRQQSPLPISGIQGFPDDRTARNLMDHLQSRSSSLNCYRVCPFHSKEYKHFCKGCEHALCADCRVEHQREHGLLTTQEDVGKCVEESLKHSAEQEAKLRAKRTCSTPCWWM